MIQNIPATIVAQPASNKQSKGRSPQKSSEQVCLHCGSENSKIGASLKPGEESHRCNDCKTFLRYSPLAKLKKARKRKELTKCLEILENRGIQGDLALFTLSLTADGGGFNRSQTIPSITTYLTLNSSQWLKGKLSASLATTLNSTDSKCSPSEILSCQPAESQSQFQVELVITPDAGDTSNASVMSRWERVVRLLQEWDWSVAIAWWGQVV
jgi:hypothetical protein